MACKEMRCTLLNSLERHLAPLCGSLTSLQERVWHQTTSLICRQLWLMILVKSYGSKDKEKLCETWSLPFFLMLLLSKRKVIRTCWFRTRRADLHYRALTTRARTLPCLSAVNVLPLSSTTFFFPLHGSFFLKLIWSCRLCHTPHS